MRHAIRTTKIDFVILEGLRTLERQKQLLASGASRTLKSRHLHGFAVDIAPIGHDGKISWSWNLYTPLAQAVKKAANQESVMITWGGDWRSFKDGPHWELPHELYPDPKN
jgi:peptidoglycan L-alanyl-D-glutamate endopeptidase CwlK